MIRSATSRPRAALLFGSAALLFTAALALLAACSSERRLTAEEKQKMIEIHTETAQQYLAMGEVDRAEGQALKGLELDKDNVKLRMIRGWALQRRGRTDDILQAEVVFRGLVNGGDYRARLGLAESLERKGMAYDEAARDLRSGKRISEAADPEQRIEELQRQARHAWEDSFREFEATLAARPADIDVLSGLIRVTTLLELRDETLKWSARLVDAAQKDLDFWEARILRPDISAAEEHHFRTLVKNLKQRQLVTLLHASTLELAAGRPAKAAEALDAAADIDPQRGEIFSRRAEVRQELGRYDDAIADLDTFLRLSQKGFDDPDVKRAWRLRSECEQRKRAVASGG
ncbi:MAG: tetratricopeptide repeat protein [Planctomycetota bacterium]